MRYFWIFLCLLIPYLNFAQERKDVGIIAGTSYYMGDFNPGTQFYKPSPMLGVMGRHNFNPFYSARLMFSYGWLKWSHNPNDYYMPGVNSPIEGNKQLICIELDGEINFISFDSRTTFKQDISPYLILGVGVAFDGEAMFPHLPVGLGVKYSPIGRLTIGAEWRLHKTFYDKLDNYSNITDPDKRKSFIHNNDWFGIAGLFVTYRLQSQGALCPAYR